MADNNLEILIVQAMLDKTVSTANIKKDLLEISKMIGSLKLSVNIDNTELTKLANSVEVITRSMSNKKIEVFDKSQLQEGQKLYANLQDVVAEYSKLGTIKVTNSSLNPITKELEGFSIAITNADNKIEKLKFDLKNISDNGNISKMFLPTKLTQTNPIVNNDKLINKNLLQEENDLKDFVAKTEQSYQKLIEVTNKNLLREENEWNSFVSNSEKSYEKYITTTGKSLLQEEKEFNDFVTKTRDSYDKLNAITNKSLLQEENEWKDFVSKQEQSYQKYLNDREKNLQQEQQINNAITNMSKNRIVDPDRSEMLAYEQKSALEKNFMGKLIQDQKVAHDAALKEDADYNAKVEANTKKMIAAKEDALIKLKDLQRRYGNSLDSNQVSTITQSVGQINPVSADAPDKIRQVNTQLKELSANAATARSNMMGFSEQFGEALRKFPVWIAVSTLVMGAIHLVRDGLQGMIDIESKMAGYVQTNEAYFTTQEKINTSTSQFIQTTHALGAEINNVLESARLYGRMYKDVGVVQELVRQSTKLSTVDLVSLADATKGMEAILAQYHAQLKNVNDAQVIGNQLLDSFSKVAHDSAIPARDLLVAYERMGSVAHDTGVSVDFMNGLLASGFRNTALSGENLGNMWKTVLGNLHSDKAVAELERLKVKTKEVVDGVEQWRKAEDIILDLSVKVIGQNGDLTKSYEDIARGVYQYQKLAASIDLGSIIQGQAASINSLGSTTEYLHTQLDTIAKKSNQVKASFLDLFNTAGNDGLRSAIKGILDVTDQLLMGTSQISTSAFSLIGTLGALSVAYLTLKNPIVNVVSAVQTLIASKIAVTAATVAESTALATNIGATEKIIVSSTGATLAKVGETVAVETTTVAITAEATAAAAATVTTALWTAGISLAVGALAIWIMNLGSAKKAEEDASAVRERSISLREQEYIQIGKQIDVIPKWVTIHNDLVKALDSGKLSAEGQSKAKNDLDKVSRALADTIGQEGFAQLKAADFTDTATQRIIASLVERKKALKQDMLNTLNEDSSSLDNSEYLALQKRNTANRELDKLNATKEKDTLFGDMGGSSGLSNFNRTTDIKKYTKQLDDANKELDDIKRKKQSNADKSLTVESDLFALNALSGSDGKSLSSTQTADEAKTTLKEKMDAFNHLVTIQSDGYTSAADKIAKLKAIKSQVQASLTDVDLYSIDEDIYKLEHPNQTSTVSSDIKMSAADTKRDMNSYARANRDLDGQNVVSEANLSKLKDTTQAYREELSKQIPIYKAKQNLAHQEAEDLRAEDAALMKRINTEKLSVSDRNALLNQLDSNQTKISQLQKSWADYDKTLSDISNKNSLSLVNEAIDKSADSTKGFEDKIKSLKTAMDSLKTDPAAKIADQNELLKVYSDEQDAIIKTNGELEALNKTLDKNSDAYIKNSDEITKNKSTLEQISANVEQERMKIATQAIDTIKKGIQLEIDAEKNLHDQKIKDIDEATNAAISAIDKIQQANDYNKNLEKDQKGAQDIQNQINAYSLDNSNEGKSKVIELKQQLATIKEKIDDEQTKRSNELVKQSLQDQNKATKESLDDQSKLKTDALQNQLNDDTHWTNLERELIKGHVEAIQTDMNNLVDGLGTYAQRSLGVVGTQVSKIQTMIEQIKSSSVNIGNLPAVNSNPASSGGSGGSGSSGGASSGFYTPKDQNETDTITTMKHYAQNWANATSAAEKKQWADLNQNWGKQIGANYDSGTGKWSKGGLPLYREGGEIGAQTSMGQKLHKLLNLGQGEIPMIGHVGELVLKDPVSAISNLMSRIKMPDFSNIIPKTNGVVGNTFNANFGAINITGDRAGANDAIGIIVNDLRRMGISINH